MADNNSENKFLSGTHIGLDKTELPLCVMLHGLFGMSSNLLGLARSLSSVCRPVIYDLPNHGNSVTLDSGSFIVMAKMLRDTIACDYNIFSSENNSDNKKFHILGHSLGGKLAMVYALLYPDDVLSLVVLDIAPVTYPPFHGELIIGLNKVMASNFTTRKEIANFLIPYCDGAEDIAQFLAKSFSFEESADGAESGSSVGAGNKIISKIRINEISTHYDVLKSFPVEEMRGTADSAGGGTGASTDSTDSSPKKFIGHTLFLTAETSEYFSDSYYEIIEEFFPSWELETIAGSGHNIHIDKPTETCDAIASFYEQLAVKTF